MPKSQAHLSIDTELLLLAKSLKINLSSEFEQWIRIRVNALDEKIETKDLGLEIAKHKEAIIEIEKTLETKESIEQQQKEENISLNKVIDNMIDSHDEKGIDWNTHIQMSASGVQLLYKRRFNRYITFKEAVELLESKLKEKGIEW